MSLKKTILLISIVLISMLHYLTPVHFHSFHSVYQRLYYVPIVLCAYWFGLRWGLAASMVSSIAYIPHILLQWAHMPMERFTQYVEIVMFFIIGSLVGLLSDIQRKQAMQIEQSNFQMRRMDRLSLLGQLAAGLAHEIRNPLGSLIGSDEILAESLGKDHPKFEFIEILQTEHRRLRDKLNEFLSFARPAVPSIIVNSVNDVIRETVKLAQKQAQKSGCPIVQKLDTELPEVPMDADLLKQIVLNLLLNACQAMPGGGTITISSWKEKGSVCIAIGDEGPGIDETVRGKLFEPFVTTKKEGTGLGLAIAKQLIESMNGHIDFESSPNGTRFTVRIPYEQQ
jgi:signal transduction histidine kinase